MDYHQIGNTNLEVSEVSFGCMSLKPESGETLISEILREAYKAGINFFDTADLYDKGLNEEMVGKALKPIRDDVIISTKVGNEWREDGSGWDWNPSKEYILTAVNESLRRLQTDYIDLYMLHGGTIDDPIEESIEAFEQLKKQGKIRAYGISSIRPNTIREWIDKSNLDVVMMQYSLLDRRPEENCLDLLHENDISVITRGTLAKGMLIDKPSKDYLGFSANDVAEMSSAVIETKYPIAASIQYVLQHPAVASAVIGIRTKEQLHDLITNYDSHIASKTLDKLKTVLKPNYYENHR
jgi:aryl-alcohol dehydrogenase-like predicted oxidoreductase